MADRIRIDEKLALKYYKTSYLDATYL